MANLPQRFPFTLAAGGVLSARLDVRCWSVIVSNFTAQYLEILDANDFVPPNTRQILSLPGVLVGQATFAAPSGVAQPVAVSGQKAYLTYTEQVLPPSGGVVGATALASQVTIERFAKAALPAAGNTGRLALLTDYNRGVLKDTGTNWVDIEGEVFNVKQFGAVGDGVTDDQAALLACAAALVASPTGGIYLMPPGTYLTSVSPTFTDATGAKKVLVWAYDAVLTTTGAIYAMTMSRIGFATSGTTIAGLTVNQRANATAIGGILLENAGHATLRDVTVMCDGTNAAYRAGIHLRNSTATDNGTGTFWAHLDDCTVARNSGVPVIPVAVLLEGGANSCLITGGRLGATDCVLIRNQSNATNTMPDGVTIMGVDMEGGVNGVRMDSTGQTALTGTPGLRIIGCRGEALTGAFLLLQAQTGSSSSPPYLAGNWLVSTVAAYITKPAGIVVNSLDFKEQLGLYPGQGLSTITQLASQLVVTAPFVTLALNSATPSVAGASYVRTNSAIATSITNFTGGVDGQLLFLMNDDLNTTLVDRAGGVGQIVVSTGANLLLTPGGTTHVFIYDGVNSRWSQVRVA